MQIRLAARATLSAFGLVLCIPSPTARAVDARSLFAQGYELIEDRQFGAAIALFEEGLAIEPDNGGPDHPGDQRVLMGTHARLTPSVALTRRHRRYVASRLVSSRGGGHGRASTYVSATMPRSDRVRS